MSSTLESLQGAFLDEPCMAALGDTIEYRPSGANRYITMLAYVDYTDMMQSLDGAQAIDQDVSVEALRSDIPTKPDSSCRVRLPKLPGKTFKPINVRSDESAAFWLFELKAVSA